VFVDEVHDAQPEQEGVLARVWEAFYDAFIYIHGTVVDVWSHHTAQQEHSGKMWAGEIREQTVDDIGGNGILCALLFPLR
jgi:hypothetical protein